MTAIAPRRRTRAWGPALAVALGLGLLWEAYALLAVRNPSVLPPPSRVLWTLWRSAPLLALHTRQTFAEAVLGLLLALAFGCGFAALIDWSPLLRRAIYPPLVVSQTIPMIALAPLLVIWFGFGILPKVLVVALVCFFPIAVAVADGLGSAAPEMERLLRSMGASRGQLFLKVRLPHALPALFSGLRIAVTYAMIGAIFGEYVGAYEGLGILMQTAKNSYRTDLVFAAIAVTAAVSIGLFLLVGVVERALLPWHVRSKRSSNRKVPKV